MLAHHYDVEDVSDVKVLASDENNGLVKVNLSFEIIVTLFKDYEDENGFSMKFPVECKAEFDKRGDRYRLHPDIVVVKVKTDEYCK